MSTAHAATRLIPENRALTAAQFQGLAEVLTELDAMRRSLPCPAS